MIVAGTCASLLGATALDAKEPFYFHKAGVERQAMLDDFAHCDDLAAGVRIPRSHLTSGNLYGAAASSFFAGFFGSRERRGMVDNVLRTCMADKGYRRIEAPRETMKALKALDREARIDRLFLLASSPDPQGKLLPR